MWLGELRRLDRAIDESSGAMCDAAQCQYDEHLDSLRTMHSWSRLRSIAVCAAAAHLVRHGHHAGEPEAVAAELAIVRVARAIRRHDPQASSLMRRLPDECSELIGSERDAVEAIARGAAPH